MAGALSGPGPFRPATSLELGRGHLDVLRREPEGRLLVCGWFLPHEPRQLEDLELRIDGVQLRVEERVLGAASPDIADAFPGAEGAGAARFFVRTTAPPAAKRDLWVQVVPLLAGRRRGLSVHAVLDPTIGVPSHAEVAMIGGGYLLHALEFFGYFVDFCGLDREATVLDVGCGIGRMAYGLVAYLRGAGSYLGFDVMGEAIAAAKRDIESLFPRFRFAHVDVANAMYRAAGGADARAFRFPAKSGWAQLVILTSVLTHLRPAAARRYLAEIARVLAPAGSALVTVFGLDAEAESLVAAGKSAQPFARVDGLWTVDAAVPEKAIGFVPADLEAWIEEAGLVVAGSYPGTWCGRPGGLSYQDLLVLRRR